jgi:hypothetical protein
MIYDVTLMTESNGLKRFISKATFRPCKGIRALSRSWSRVSNGRQHMGRDSTVRMYFLSERDREAQCYVITYMRTPNRRPVGGRVKPPRCVAGRNALQSGARCLASLSSLGVENTALYLPRIPPPFSLFNHDSVIVLPIDVQADTPNFHTPLHTQA